jgi:hypothetical protein
MPSKQTSVQVKRSLSQCLQCVRTATAGEGALALSVRVSYAHKTQVTEIAEMKAQLANAQATALNLEDLKAKTLLLVSVQSLLGKQSCS